MCSNSTAIPLYSAIFRKENKKKTKDENSVWKNETHAQNKTNIINEKCTHS